jgi:hypothetical protein
MSVQIRRAEEHDREGRVAVFRWVPGLPGGGEDLARVLAQEDTKIEVELVAVNTDEEAQRLRFPGSPTIRVDGEDLFPYRSGRSTRLVAGCTPPRRG